MTFYCPNFNCGEGFNKKCELHCVYCCRMGYNYTITTIDKRSPFFHCCGSEKKAPHNFDTRKIFHCTTCCKDIDKTMYHCKICHGTHKKGLMCECRTPKEEKNDDLVTFLPIVDIVQTKGENQYYANALKKAIEKEVITKQIVVEPVKEVRKGLLFLGKSQKENKKIAEVIIEKVNEEVVEEEVIEENEKKNEEVVENSEEEVVENSEEEVVEDNEKENEEVVEDNEKENEEVVEENEEVVEENEDNKEVVEEVVEENVKVIKVNKEVKKTIFNKSANKNIKKHSNMLELNCKIDTDTGMVYVNNSLFGKLEYMLNIKYFS